MPQNNVYDAKDQVSEMIWYYQYLHDHGSIATPEDACREWVRKYAKQWRDYKNQGIENPTKQIRNQYIIAEDQFKWPSDRHRRVQSQHRSTIRKTKLIRKCLAEQLDEILKP